MEEVEWSVNAINGSDGRDRGNTATFASRAGAIKRAGVIPSVVGTVKEVLYHLVGSSNVELINIIKLGPRGGGKGRGGNNGGEGRRGQH